MCKEQIVEICGIREQLIVERKYNLEEEARSWSHIREKERLMEQVSFYAQKVNRKFY